jgi:hypothetical protein
MAKDDWDFDVGSSAGGGRRGSAPASSIGSGTEPTGRTLDDQSGVAESDETGPFLTVAKSPEANGAALT